MSIGKDEKRTIRERDTPTSRAAKKAPRAAPDEARSPTRPWRTLTLGLAGSFLGFLALPPADLWPLAWIAPIPWVLLIRSPSLSGRRPYRALYLAGFAYWAMAMQWLRLPHPATAVGGIVLCAYLGVYLPLFVGLSRVAVWRWRLPLALVCPVVWTGLELGRSYFASGFNFANLTHSQVHWLTLIQLADLAGAYGISFLLLLVAAGVARAIPWAGRPGSIASALVALAALAGALGYGHVRLGEETTRPGVRVALVQGAIDTRFDQPVPAEESMRQYIELSRQAAEAKPRPDLIVWPEAMFRSPLLTHDEEIVLPDGFPLTEEEFKDRESDTRRALEDFAGKRKGLGVPVLVGLDTVHADRTGITRYNSALLIDPQEGVGQRYDKVHPVMFGEYIPFAKWAPWLYRWTPLEGGIEAGERTTVFRVGETKLAATICFESMLPQLPRGQVASARSRGEEPDVLLNLSNDGWFWGSSALDLHLACNILRAVECRKPMLVAANTGISAWIDGSGRVLARGPKRKTEVIVADAQIDGRRSWYVVWGDGPVSVCLLFVIAIGLVAAMEKWQSRAGRKANKTTGPIDR